jgi:hypothetical protein
MELACGMSGNEAAGALISMMARSNEPHPTRLRKVCFHV